MNRRAASTSADVARSRCAAGLVVLALLLQLVFSAHHATVMAAGTEICTSEGSKRLYGDADPAQTTGVHHDCCCTGNPPAPPAVLAGLDQSAAGPLTVDSVSARRLAAQWLAPLSRGPPSFS